MARKLTKQFFIERGRKGGKKAWANLTKAERTKINSERARKAWITRRRNTAAKERAW